MEKQELVDDLQSPGTRFEGGEGSEGGPYGILPGGSGLCVGVAGP